MYFVLIWEPQAPEIARSADASVKEESRARRAIFER